LRRHTEFLVVFGQINREQMTWRETVIVVGKSVLLAAAITVAVRIVMENLTFETQAHPPAGGTA
jgi:hypothetical protein